MIIEIGIFILYMVMLVGIGVYTARRTKSYAGFNLADRANNKWIAGISTQTSSTSGWMLLGMPAAAYFMGFGVVWILLGWLTGALFNWMILAKRLRLETEKQGAVSLVEFFSTISNDKTGRVALASGVSIIVLMIINVGAEIIGSGKLLEAAFGIDFRVGVTIGIAITMLYTFLGGYLAVSWTNLIEGAMMFLVLLLVPLALLVVTGGFGAFTPNLYAQDPYYFTFLSGTTGFWRVVAFITGGFGIALMYPGMIHNTTGLIAIKKPEEIKFSALIAIVWGAVALLGATTIGMVGRYMFPAVADPEQILLVLSIELFPSVAVALVAAAVVAAILSSISAYLIVSAASIGANIVKKQNAITDEKKVVRIEKIAIVIISIGAYIMALQGGEVFAIALFAASGLGASFGPITIAGAFGKKVHRNAATASILLGMLVVIIWHYSGLSDTVIFEVFPGWVASTLALVIGSKIYKGKN